MEQDLKQLLAERLGFTKEEYEALQAGDVSQFISTRFSDPLLAAVSTSMLQKNSDSPEAPKSEDELERALVRAKKIIQKLKNDLAAADVMLKYVADVFGACPACWGQNKLCSRCKGNGKPGSAEPLEEELLAWIEPALEKLGIRITREPKIE